MSNPKTESAFGIEVAMRTAQNHRRELTQTLEGLKDRVNATQPECDCEVFEDLAVPNRFLWSEWWPGQEESEAAEASDRFRALLGAIKVLGSLESVRKVSRTSSATQEMTRLENEDNRH